jgi:hypothetical protein
MEFLTKVNRVFSGLDLKLSMSIFIKFGASAISYTSPGASQEAQHPYLNDPFIELVYEHGDGHLRVDFMSDQKRTFSLDSRK